MSVLAQRRGASETPLDQYPLRDTAIYNPHLLSREELIGLFSARQQLLERLLEDLSRCEAGETPQHHLLVAQRGMGKTMLLRRLQFAIEDDSELASVWLPLTFPEEQYNVGGLSDLWLNCIDALGVALERRGRTEEAKRLDSQLEAFLHLEEEERARETLTLLMSTADALERRLVLLIDNIDLILERISDQAWTLREALSEERAILLIGASARALESSYKYDQPFYDFFQIHELGGLSLEETEDLLRHYAERWQSAEVLRIVGEEPARVRTLHTLSGGNPRTVALLYNIFGRGLEGDVRTDLENLLDQCTPLYKARLEALAPQRQRVVHALAVHWHPATAAQVAGELRLDVKAVSSQLTRLVRDGVVEAVAFDPPGKSGFQLAERFFNIWYLMRATRRARRRLIWLVEFLKMSYSQDRLREHALGFMRNKPHGGGLRGAEYSFAMAMAVEDAALRQSLETSGLRLLMGDEHSRWNLNELLDLGGADAHLRTRAEHLERLQGLRSRVLALRVGSSQWSPTDFWERLARSPVPLAAKEELVSGLVGATPERLAELEGRVERVCRKAEESVDCNQAAADLFTAFREGYLLAADDVEGARTAAAALNLPSVVPLVLSYKVGSEPSPERLAELHALLESSPSPMPGLVWLLHVGKKAEEADVCRVIDHALRVQGPSLQTLLLLAETAYSVGRLNDAETVLRQVVQLEPEVAAFWSNLGMILGEQGRAEEAEVVGRRAVEIDPGSATAWYNLGNSVRRQGRDEEAETAYREALRIDPQMTVGWNNLGKVLSQQDRHEAAEDAFREALKVNPESAAAWSNLGQETYVNGRHAEAKKAFRKALAIDPENAGAWNNLGGVLYTEGRREKAEKAFRKALSIDRRFSHSSFNLAIVLADGRRYEEAEQALRKTLDLEPDNAVAWARLGDVVYQQDRATEAEGAYRKAIGLTAGDAAPLNSLAWLLFEQRRDLTEAKELAAAAVALDEDQLYFAHTYATILVVNGEWSKAAEHARRFLAGPKDFHADIWSDIVVFFKEAVAHGHVTEAVALLDASALGDTWQPLREALETVALGRRSYLKRLAPEVRQPTEEILEQLGWTEPSDKGAVAPAKAAPLRRTSPPSDKPRPASTSSGRGAGTG